MSSTLIAERAATVRVYIVEAQLLFGKAMAQALRDHPGIQIVGISADREAIVHARNAIDVVVIDIDDIDDIDETIEFYKSLHPRIRLCALSVHAQPAVLQRCLSAGAEAYIVKNSSLHEFTTAIKTLGRGGSYVDPRVAANYFRRRAPANAVHGAQLSPRETEIIRLIAQGMSNRDIGKRLMLSEKTVKNHVSHIFSKLHFTTRSQAAVHAIRTGLA